MRYRHGAVEVNFQHGIQIKWTCQWASCKPYPGVREQRRQKGNVFRRATSFRRPIILILGGNNLNRLSFINWSVSTDYLAPAIATILVIEDAAQITVDIGVFECTDGCKNVHSFGCELNLMNLTLIPQNWASAKRLSIILSTWRDRVVWGSSGWVNREDDLVVEETK